MNIPSASDDNDFPVFKAGPPLPIRTKGKPHFKTKSTTPLKATNSAVISSQSKICSSTSTAKTSVNAESKVKQYIERVKAKDELGRKKRMKAEQMLSLEDLYQVHLDETASGQPKKPNACKSLDAQSELSVAEVQEKLRETMRIVKEKDELINKLRESCHDLAIKCADAENRVDELRFSYGRSSSMGREVEQKSPSNLKSRGSISMDASNNNNNGQLDETQFHRRSASTDALFTRATETETECQGQEQRTKINKATEISVKVLKQDAHTQVEPQACDAETLSAQEVGHWREEDDILQETCSNWMEKVQNWKTNSNFNLSQDSGGDRDSGFRSSVEIDNESILRQQRLISSKPSGKTEERLLERSQKLSKRSETVQVPQMSSLSSATLGAVRRASCSAANNLPEDEELRRSLPHQHFWPSFTSSQSYFHLSHLPNENISSDTTKAKSLFYELAEAERNKYACFQEGFNGRSNPSQSYRLHGAKSLDVLYFPQTAHHRTKEELRSLIDSSFEPPEFILKSHLNSQHRSIDKKVKMLDPLLDDATQIALRVKQKSERLAKMLQDACTFD